MSGGGGAARAATGASGGGRRAALRALTNGAAGATNSGLDARPPGAAAGASNAYSGGSGGAEGAASYPLAGDGALRPSVGCTTTMAAWCGGREGVGAMGGGGTSNEALAPTVFWVLGSALCPSFTAHQWCARVQLTTSSSRRGAPPPCLARIPSHGGHRPGGALPANHHVQGGSPRRAGRWGGQRRVPPPAQVFKFALYVAVPVGLTWAVVYRPAALQAIIENVRARPCCCGGGTGDDAMRVSPTPTRPRC